MKFKLKAFFYHLLVSVAVAGVVGAFVFFVWYPAPLARATGVGQIFWMMLGIDVVLGPLMTLLVAKQGKKTLKMDLAVIGVVQVVALLYGLYNIGATRPVFIAYDETRFELIQANQLDLHSESVHLGYGRPKLVAVRPVMNDGERFERINHELQSGYSPASQPNLHQDIELARPQIAQQGMALEMLNTYNDSAQVAASLSQYPEAAKYYPLKSANIDMTVLVDAEGEVIKIVDLRPWQ